MRASFPEPPDRSGPPSLGMSPPGSCSSCLSVRPMWRCWTRSPPVESGRGVETAARRGLTLPSARAALFPAALAWRFFLLLAGHLKLEPSICLRVPMLIGEGRPGLRVEYQSVAMARLEWLAEEDPVLGSLIGRVRL